VFKTIGVVGMGYVGLTLTAALARKGYTVFGTDTSPEVVASLTRGRPHIFEPGVEEVFGAQANESIIVDTRLPLDRVDAAVICVSTPIDESTKLPVLTNLTAAAQHVAHSCSPDTLVVVRSTVPVGTTRSVVLPELLAEWGSARLVMAPERTIQGRALREIVELPQVVGGLDEDSLAAGTEFFGGLAASVVPVSSLEAAELVKLSNNCHTDLIYAYGNEIALVAERHGLDPLEIIHAANHDYPRPDLARPGFVGGGCLSKDPYLMISSFGDHEPYLVRRGRQLNEYLPAYVALRVVQLLRAERGDTAGARLAVLGWAYKGWPPTDDMRGTPIATMMPVFDAAGLTVLGHDPMVSPEVIQAYGGQPVSLDKAFSDSDAVLVLTDHPDYGAIELGSVLGAQRPKLIYDSWRILDEQAITAAGVRYAGIGYLPNMPAAMKESVS
jgi:UDP-N-acetyl-D-mannosaminuronic acid dehydrogenase